MVKPGDRHLRRQLLRFTLSMLAHYPALQTYRNRLLQRGKGKITANIAALRERLGAPLLGSVPRVAGSNPAAAASFLELPPVT